jgi:hypothetical protein
MGRICGVDATRRGLDGASKSSQIKIQVAF